MQIPQFCGLGTSLHTVTYIEFRVEITHEKLTPGGHPPEDLEEGFCEDSTKRILPQLFIFVLANSVRLHTCRYSKQAMAESDHVLEHHAAHAFVFSNAVTLALCIHLFPILILVFNIYMYTLYALISHQAGLQ